MEAKGCAKSCVWKDARRRFYWLLRARLAESRLLNQLEKANPESTPQYRSQVIIHLLPMGSEMQERAEKLETLDISSNVAQFRSDYILQAVRKASQVDRKSAIGGILRFVEELTDDEKASLLTSIQNSARMTGGQSAD